jgi:hypothetical protein
MKKHFVLITGLAVILTIFLSCEKKGDKNAIKPEYGSTGNPYPNNQTVTGSTTFTNPATVNTVLQIGGGGWSNPTCASTNSATLKAFSGDVDVTLTFASAATSNTYNISTTPSSGNCALTILNAPGQPAGTVWVGKTGMVVVYTTSNSINATFTGVVCTQQTFNFPTVTASGFLGCAQ